MLKYLRSEERAARSEDLDTGTGTQALRPQSPHLPSLLVSAGSLWWGWAAGITGSRSVSQHENPGSERASPSFHIALPGKDLIGPAWVTWPVLGPTTLAKRMGIHKSLGLRHSLLPSLSQKEGN